VLLGKLATHEYAFGVTTNNPHWGPTRNPWDTTRIPGGSSGGSGAAVAARMACGAIGTDTGGSIRMPAAVCGVVGLKPTYGRVSKTGVFPMSYLFDHVGPLTRTVEDAAIMLGAIAGYDAGDATTVPMPVDDYRARLGDGMRGLRIGVPRSLFTPVDRAVLAAVEEALVTLADLGTTVREVSVPEFPMPGMFDLIIAEAKEIHADTLANRMDDLGADVALYLSAPHGDAVALALALRHVREYAAGVRMVLHDQVDLLVLPTCPIGAPPIGTDVVDVGGEAVQTFFAMSLRTAPFNAAGVPALTVPCGFTPGGLPIGLQIVGRPFDEVTVLRAGHAYEQATEWHRRRPPE
jgi:aspartyl-tRNA(Asn)/glutamyl-tRNA(Gln) amidotransferase subunit A